MPSKLRLSTRYTLFLLLGMSLLLAGVPGHAGRLPIAQHDELARLFQEGSQAFNRRDYPAAQQAWQTAFERAQAAGDQYSMGAFLDALGGVYGATGKLDKALDFYNRALAIREKLGRKADIARTLGNLGAVYLHAGQLSQSADSYARSVALWEEVGDQNVVAIYLDDLGSVRTEMGQHQRAVELLTRALKIREQLGHTQQIGESLTNLGNAYMSQGQFDQAAQYYSHALEIADAGRDKPTEAATLNNLGNVYSDLGQYDRAMDYLTRALADKEALGDKHDVASTLGNVGLVYAHLGQYDKAIDCCNRALTVAQEFNDTPLTVTLLNDLGVLYDGLGQTNKALDNYGRILALEQDNSNPQFLATVLVNVGAIHLHQGEPRAALECFTHALELDKTGGNKKAIAATLVCVGNAYNTLRQFDPALDCYTRALALQEEIGNQQEIADTLNSLGGAYKGMGKPAQAIDYCNRSLAIKKKIGNPRDLGVTYGNLALIYYDANQLDKAEAAFAAALENDEAVSAQIEDASQVGAFQETEQYGLYTRYAVLLLRRNRPGEALVTVERGRAQGLARQAAQNREGFTRLLPAAEAERLRAKADACRTAAHLLRAVEEHSPIADPHEQTAYRERLAEARKRSEEAESALQQVRTELCAKYPAYRQRQGAKPPTLAELTALADRRPDTLFVEWSVGEYSTLLFALSHKDGLKAFTLPVGEAKLQEMVSAWRHSILTGAAGEEAEAKALDTTLFAPLEKAGLLPAGSGADIDGHARTLATHRSSGGYRHLMLVGDGPLLDLPFAALMTADGKRLIDHCALASAVSLGVLTWEEEPGKPTGTMLCAADPLGPGGATLRTASRGGFEALPAARREGAAVAALFPGALILTGEAATKTEVLRRMDQYRLLHFATHGVLDEENGLRSGLLFAPDKGEDVGAEVLEAREIMERKLSAQLAVLSACATGEGQKSGGDGLLGLAWAFRAAGCPSVVASQWSVDDAATGRLMVAFYTALKAGKPKDEALREAILSVKSAPKNKKPAFWAAFQVLGDPSPLDLGAVAAR